MSFASPELDVARSASLCQAAAGVRVALGCLQATEDAGGSGRFARLVGFLEELERLAAGGRALAQSPVRKSSSASASNPCGK